MEGLLDFLTGLSLLLIVMVLVSVRRSHTRVEHSVSWLGAAVVLLVLSRWPGLLGWLASVLGITSPPMALLTLVGCVFLLVLFRLSVIISALKDANIALTQRIAILEFQLESVHEESKSKS
jgi:hypothetical protein